MVITPDESGPFVKRPVKDQQRFQQSLAHGTQADNNKPRTGSERIHDLRRPGHFVVKPQ